ncbi:small ribosomal subunit protein mS37-like [Halichondria panicea]|uniref:small ribosomal subunit protein mS37-like n=1 Tax=Halichondria panicea TaxID=6063 RepID=UPI00312B655A
MVRGSVSLCKRRFHGMMRAMKLKSSVRMSRKSSSSPTCMSEMTAVMSCWKVNTFDDVSCTSEIKRFLECVEKAGQEPAESRVTTGYRWPTEEVNKQLRHFVWAQ